LTKTTATAVRAVLSVALAALVAAVAAAGPKKPSIELKVLPQMGSPATTFLFVVTLSGGVDSEELHCLTLEWAWDAGDNSTSEGECEPFEPGRTRIQRRFTTERQFRTEGPRRVEVVVRKGERTVARSSTTVRVTWEKKPPQFGVGPR